MTQNEKDLKNTENFLLALVGEAELRATRIRKTGSFCFFCGVEQSLGMCRCGLTESLECGGQRVCADCRAAHAVVSAHIKAMLAAKITDRSSSIRAKKYYQLHNAAEAVDEKYGTPFEKQLQFALSQVCPFDDERAEFRAGILGSFAQSQFSDYQMLAKELQRETEAEIRHHIARLFSSCAM